MSKKSGLFYITYEGKYTLENVQKEFKEHLSPSVIARKTAFALNVTATRSGRFVEKEVAQDYTMQKEYLKKMAKRTKAAGAKSNNLYAEVSYNFDVFKIQMFKYAPTSKRGGVQVEIKRGKSVFMKHLFVRQMENGHIGVFGRGEYRKQKFVPGYFLTKNGNKKITDMLTTSPYSAALSNKVTSKTLSYIENSLPGRLRAMLQQEIDKMK